MKLKVTRAEKAYLIPQLSIERATYKMMGNLIREGWELDVKSSDGLDYTGETLVKIAFEDLFPPNIKNEIIAALADVIDHEKLYLVIENGGIQNYLNRRARGAIYGRT